MTLPLQMKRLQRLQKAGFDPVYGARPLRRAIQSKIEDELSELMLEGKVDSEHGVTCDYRDDAFVFDVKIIQ